jgi:hypothetical protein
MMTQYLGSTWKQFLTQEGKEKFHPPTRRTMIITPQRVKLVVQAAHSQVFLQKLKKLEAESMGDKDMSIEVHVEPDSLDSFIRYMYTGNVSPREMTIHATKLLKAARRYSVGSLQTLAEHHIAKSVTCETALSTWELGSDHSSEIIKKAVIDTLLSQHDMKQVLHLSEYPTYRTQKKSTDLLVALFENLFSKTMTSTTATAATM